MKTAPPTIEDTYDRVRTGIDALGQGDEHALDTLRQLTEEIPDWFRQHREMLHSTPSPSSIMKCRAQQWYNHQKIDRDQGTSYGWKVMAAMGILQEPYWLAVLSAGGFNVILPNETFACGPHMRAHPDAILDTDFLVELKRESGWGYKRLLERPGGVVSWEHENYMQAQLYMYATGKEWCLYLTSPADYSLLQSNMRQSKKYDRHYVMPEVYLEWLMRDEEAVERGLKRAEMIVEDIKLDHVPPREFSGFEFKPSGARSWPCGYCMWLSRCGGDNDPGKLLTDRAGGDIQWLR